MQIAMIGLSRMGARMARRLLTHGHRCAVHDTQLTAADSLANDGATAYSTPGETITALAKPRVVWLMVPAAVVDQALGDLVPLLDTGDIVSDGGNSYYGDDMRRGNELRAAGIHDLDVGTSGGAAGMERGHCFMIGGDAGAFEHLWPIFSELAPGSAAATRTPGRAGVAGDAEEGVLHCGPQGAGCFVKLVHDGIEYGLMAACSEGLNIVRHANICNERQRLATHDAETTPLRDPALAPDNGRVSDSGEVRWTIRAAIDEGVPAPVLIAAMYERFTSRGNTDFANRILSAMRQEFGGHVEKPSP